MYEAAASWCHVRGLPTTNGKWPRPARFGTVAVLWLLAGACLLAGCASTPPMTADDLTAAKRHMDFLLSEARTASTTMRTEMANARIAVAKQEGDLKELRQQAAELRQALDSKQTELTGIRTERDKVAQAKTDLQTQLQSQIQTQNGEIAKLRATASELEIVKAKVADLESQLTTRTAELVQAKKDLDQQQQQQQQAKAANKGAKADAKGKKPEASASLTPPSQKPPAGDKLAPAPTPKATPPESSRMAQEEHPSASTGQDVRLADSRPGTGAPGKLTVKPGESLSIIAQRFGVTVDQLKQANGLQRDQLEPGQLLIIPPMKPTP